MAVTFERAEAEAGEYADALDAEYLGLTQAYLLSDVPVDGGEVFSLMRVSDQPPAEYLSATSARGPSDSAGRWPSAASARSS